MGTWMRHTGYGKVSAHICSFSTDCAKNSTDILEHAVAISYVKPAIKQHMRVRTTSVSERSPFQFATPKNDTSVVKAQSFGVQPSSFNWSFRSLRWILLADLVPGKGRRPEVRLSDPLEKPPVDESRVAGALSWHVVVGASCHVVCVLVTFVASCD